MHNASFNAPAITCDQETKRRRKKGRRNVLRKVLTVAANPADLARSAGGRDHSEEPGPQDVVPIAGVVDPRRLPPATVPARDQPQGDWSRDQSATTITGVDFYALFSSLDISKSHNDDCRRFLIHHKLLLL